MQSQALRASESGRIVAAGGGSRDRVLIAGWCFRSTRFPGDIRSNIGFRPRDAVRGRRSMSEGRTLSRKLQLEEFADRFPKDCPAEGASAWQSRGLARDSPSLLMMNRSRADALTRRTSGRCCCHLEWLEKTTCSSPTASRVDLPRDRIVVMTYRRAGEKPLFRVAERRGCPRQCSRLERDLSRMVIGRTDANEEDQRAAPVARFETSVSAAI